LPIIKFSSSRFKIFTIFKESPHCQIITSMRFALFFVASLFTLVSYAQQRGEIVSYTLVQTLTADSFGVEVEQYTGFPGSVLGLEYDFKVYKVQYYTEDYRPDSLTVATGLVTLPTGYPCPSGIMTFGHGFCLKDGEVPSNPGSIYGMITKGIASNGFVGIAPDYIHLGVDASPGFQAFMNAKTEATATVDLIRAAKTIAQNEGVDLTDQLFLSGYSQGGHSSFATAREIQLYHAGELTVTAVAPGGGTFDLAGVAADSLASNTRVTPEPHALCMIVRTYAEVYRDSLFNLNLPNDPAVAFDSVFKHPYDSLLALILDRNTNEYPSGRLDSIPVRMLTDTFRAQFQNDPNFYFRKLLAYNSLYDWTPQMPVNFYHSTADIENPVSNVQFVMQVFEDNNAPDVQLTVISTELSHGAAGLPYVILSLNYMRSKRVDCLTGTENLAVGKEIEWNIYPNPTQDFINVTFGAGLNGATVNVYTPKGEVVSSISLNANTTEARLDIAKLAAGTYVVEVVTESSRLYRKVVKM
jgi:hypothetical protein